MYIYASVSLPSVSSDSCRFPADLYIQLCSCVIIALFSLMFILLMSDCFVTSRLTLKRRPSTLAGQGVANYCDATMFKVGRRMGIRSRSALISAVFRKAMALDMSSANAGQLQVTCDA